MWFRSSLPRVICIGSVSKDIFFPTDEALLLDTPDDITAKQKIAFELGGKYRVKDRYEAVGGVAANVACGLVRLGHQAAVYSCVGDDDMGKSITQSLDEEGVETRLIKRLGDAKTDLSAIVVMEQNGERTIFHNRDANERLEVSPDSLRGAPWLFVSALNGDWPKNLANILSAKQSYDAKIALNPGQHNIKDDAKRIVNFLEEVDVLLLNKDEAIELLLHAETRPSDDELNDERFLLATLYSLGARVIGMTDGKRGAWGYDGTEYWYCPIHTRDKVVDSTGAGDAFGSGFFSAILSGLPLSQALRYGMANSGSVVGFYGAIAGLLRVDDLTALLPLIHPERLQ